MRTAPSALIPLLAVLALSGCAVEEITATDKFAGCYDRSCVGAPVPVAGVPALVSLSTRTTHTCGLSTAGDAWCWGSNSTGQLGDGTEEPRTLPVKVAGGHRFTSIAVGGSFTCAIATGGVVHCWGLGALGTLGQDAPDGCGQSQVKCAKLPLAIAGRTFTTIAAGLRHACAVDSAGATYCWGFNFLGETGSAEYGTSTLTPRLVAGANTFATLSAGDAYTCALTTTGRAWCWGSADRGELGTTAQVRQCTSVAGFVNYCSPTPVPVASTATMSHLSAGSSHACALTTGGAALCWGDNGQGQLGTLTYANQAAPVTAHGGTRFTMINASGAATCGTPATGPSVCWGLNLMGKLGVGTRVELSPTPLPIAGERRYAVFAGGAQHVCATTSDGQAYCWGSGREGQLGGGPRAP